jgi:integrase
LNAQERLDAIRGLLGEAGAPASGPTFREVWERYWREDARGKRSARDIERIGNELCARWGDRVASTLTSRDGEDYRDARSAVITRLGKPVSPQTIDNELSQARRALNWACDQRPPMLEYNGLARVRMARPLNARKSKVKTEADLQLLLAECSPLLEALVLLYIDCGPRRMEAISMEWAQLEVTRDRARVELWRTKNKKRRHIRLSLRTLAAILRLPRFCRWVFASKKTNKAYSARWLYALFLKAVKRAGLTGVDGETICFHTLRHSFAYLRRTRDKISRQAIMKQGGWIDPKVFDRYGIPDDDELDDMYVEIDKNIADELKRLRASERKPAHTRTIPNDPDLLHGRKKTRVEIVK